MLEQGGDSRLLPVAAPMPPTSGWLLFDKPNGSVRHRLRADSLREARSGERRRTALHSNRPGLDEQHDQRADDKAENLKLDCNRIEQKVTLTATRHDTAPRLQPPDC